MSSDFYRRLTNAVTTLSFFLASASSDPFRKGLASARHHGKNHGANLIG